MSNLPNNPKPHIGEEVIRDVPKISPSDRKKAIEEMKELIRENNKIVARHRTHNETVYE